MNNRFLGHGPWTRASPSDDQVRQHLLEKHRNLNQSFRTIEMNTMITAPIEETKKPLGSAVVTVRRASDADSSLAWGGTTAR